MQMHSFGADLVFFSSLVIFSVVQILILVVNFFSTKLKFNYILRYIRVVYWKVLLKSIEIRLRVFESSDLCWETVSPVDFLIVNLPNRRKKVMFEKEFWSWQCKKMTKPKYRSFVCFCRRVAVLNLWVTKVQQNWRRALMQWYLMFWRLHQKNMP